MVPLVVNGREAWRCTQEGRHGSAPNRVERGHGSTLKAVGMGFFMPFCSVRGMELQGEDAHMCIQSHTCAYNHTTSAHLLHPHDISVDRLQGTRPPVEMWHQVFVQKGTSFRRTVSPRSIRKPGLGGSESGQKAHLPKHPGFFGVFFFFPPEVTDPENAQFLFLLRPPALPGKQALSVGPHSVLVPRSPSSC